MTDGRLEAPVRRAWDGKVWAKGLGIRAYSIKLEELYFQIYIVTLLTSSIQKLFSGECISHLTYPPQPSSELKQTGPKFSQKL